VVDPEVTRHWVRRYGPYLGAVLAARMTLDRLLAEPVEHAAVGGSAPEASLVDAGFDILRSAVELAARIRPVPDQEADAAFRSALDSLNRAAVTFMHPSGRVETVRTLLAQADRQLIRLRDRLMAPLSEPHSALARARE
jgi:hypothetical protein